MNEKTNPQSSEDWQEYFKKDKELSEKIKKASHNYIEMSDTEFKNMIAQWNVSKLKVYMTKMRSEMIFYKNVINEPYYHNVKHRGHRFNDSKRKYESINRKGKIIAQLIKQKQS